MKNSGLPALLLAAALAFMWLKGTRLEGTWAPAGHLPRAVSQVLDDPQWADLEKASDSAPA